MTSFRDKQDRTWKIELDGLLLADVRSETGIDLVDLSAGGLAKIEQDAISLVQVLCVLCRDDYSPDLTDRQFAKLLTGEVLELACAAVLEAVACFFRPKKWSEVRSAFENQKTFDAQWIQLRPMLAKLNEPEMESIRPAVMEALTEMMSAGDSAQLESMISATGPADTPSTAATASPENAELTPVG